jgi:hypothetical protein
MSEQNMVVVNNVEKGRRDNLLKGRDRERPSADIRMPISSDGRGANPPKIEFFNAVARLEAGLVQFSNVLDQRG